MKYRLSLVAALVVLGACDGSTGPGGGGTVAIRFGTSAGSNLSADVQLSGSPSLASDLTVTGTNGTLVIQDIRFIVSRLKLEQSEGMTCTGSSNSDDDRGGNGSGNGSGNSGRNGGRSGENETEREHDSECNEFEGGPFLVDLPLAGLTSITTDNVPAGTYDAFSFRIRNVDDIEDNDNAGDDDASERHNASAVLAEMRTFYPNFPANASMVVKGTFNGKAFTTYFRSQLQIEQKLDTPLTVPGDKSLQVLIDPTAWFRNGTQVLDLASLNGRTVDLGSGFRKGVRGANRGRD